LTLILQLALFAGLMVLSAFFSSAETSLFSLNRVDLEQMRRDEHPRLHLIERLLAQPRRLIVSILIGNEFVNVAASTLSAAVVIGLLGPEQRWLNLFVMVPVLLLFGEITPKTLAIRNNVTFAAFQSRYVDLFARAIWPIRWAVRGVSDFFTTLIVGRERTRANLVTEDMVRSLADEAVGEGALDHREAHYIKQILAFGERTLRDVMTPRSQLVVIPANTPLVEVASAVQHSGHTRVPVEDADSTVVGILYARDLLDLDTLRQGPDTDLATLLRPTYSVPETKSVAALFRAFRHRKLSMALVVDEYGGITGLVTMEDLLESIFGEIPSRSDQRGPRFAWERTDEGEYRVDGALPLERLDRLVGISLDGGPAETVGGLLLHRLGELPHPGASATVAGVELRVLAVSGQRITSVLIDTTATVEG